MVYPIRAHKDLRRLHMTTTTATSDPAIAGCFRLVEPLAGFDPWGESAALSPTERPGITGIRVASPPAGDGATLRVRGRCSVRTAAEGKYLQCELRFPDDGGWLEVMGGDRVIDRAELIAGWQHSAIELGDIAPGTELTLLFRRADGTEADEVEVRAIFLADEWGLGQRKRLKCYYPFTLAAIFTDSSVYPCCARQWLGPDQCAGSTRTETLTELWNGAKYQEMRRDFLAGDYGRSCREDACPLLSGAGKTAEPTSPAVIRAVNEGHVCVEHGPTFLYHDIDVGCNLECVMCRDAKILPDAANVDRAVADIRSAIDLGAIETIAFSGAGEIFVMSKIVRLLESDTFSSRGIRLAITTNLTHFTERLWQRIGHNRFDVVVVSADGCSPEVYDTIRVGSTWAKVEANMRYLARLRAEGKVAQIAWNYTVQRGNVADVGRAIGLARELGFDAIRLIGQIAARTRTNGNMFEDHDVAALDALYAELEAAEAFDDPRVGLAELGVARRQYRSFEHRIELAQHLFERREFTGDSTRPIAAAEWRACLELVAGLRTDVAAGVTEVPHAMPQRFVEFLGRFAEEGARAGRLRNQLRHHWRRSDAAREVRNARVTARWARALVRDARRDSAAPS